MEERPLSLADALNPQGEFPFLCRQFCLYQAGHPPQDVGPLALQTHPVKETVQFQEKVKDLSVGVEVETVEADFLHTLGPLQLSRHRDQVSRREFPVGLPVVSLKAEGAEGGTAPGDLEVGRVGLRGIQDGVYGGEVLRAGPADRFDGPAAGSGDPEAGGRKPPRPPAVPVSRRPSAPAPGQSPRPAPPLRRRRCRLPARPRPPG